MAIFALETVGFIKILLKKNKIPEKDQLKMLFFAQF
jgi:hypothetical protein